MSWDDTRARRNGLRVYGEWAGNPKGQLENIEYCVESVYRNGRMIEAQCSKKRGHGKDGLYCKQHAKHNPQEAS